MNDDTLMTAVRGPFTAVHMDTPVEQIVRRGRAMRARRRILGLAGAAAVIAGAAVAATALLPGRPPGRRATGGLDGDQAGERHDRCHDPRAARRGPAAEHAPRGWRARPPSPSAASRTRRAGSTRQVGAEHLGHPGEQRPSRYLRHPSRCPAARRRSPDRRQVRRRVQHPRASGEDLHIPQPPAKSPASGVVRVPVIGPAWYRPARSAPAEQDRFVCGFGCHNPRNRRQSMRCP